MSRSLILRCAPFRGMRKAGRWKRWTPFSSRSSWRSSSGSAPRCRFSAMQTSTPKVWIASLILYLWNEWQNISNLEKLALWLHHNMKHFYILKGRNILRWNNLVMVLLWKCVLVDEYKSHGMIMLRDQFYDVTQSIKSSRNKPGILVPYHTLILFLWNEWLNGCENVSSATLKVVAEMMSCMKHFLIC